MSRRSVQLMKEHPVPPLEQAVMELVECRLIDLADFELRRLTHAQKKVKNLNRVSLGEKRGSTVQFTLFSGNFQPVKGERKRRNGGQVRDESVRAVLWRQ